MKDKGFYLAMLFCSKTSLSKESSPQVRLRAPDEVEDPGELTAEGVEDPGELVEDCVEEFVDEVLCCG